MSDPSRPTFRRLAAVLHADVAGYSGLMSRDESGTQAAVSRAFARSRRVAEAHGGRVVSTAGDAFLAEFPSVVEAVAAALDFLAEVGEESPGEGPSLSFRVGVNLGDVIVEGDDIFGEGVNVAARVQELAPPGAVAVTAAVKEQLGNRLDVRFESIGPRRLKNLPGRTHVHLVRPPSGAAPERGVANERRRVPLRLAAAVVALCVVLFAAWALFGSGRQDRATDPAGAAGRQRVVAVLPFDGSGAGAPGYFADGFTEDVIADLGRFPELLVLSWNSVLPFRDRAADLSAIRSGLRADYVVGGSVRRDGGKIRVSVQLTDAGTGVLLWSDRYDTDFSDVFEVQDKIAGAVAGSLAEGLERTRQREARTLPAGALDAYDHVLRGRALLERIDRDDNYEAREFFRKALSIDPGYAEAQAGVAATFLADLNWGWSADPATTLRLATEEADRALRSDADSIWALATLSQLKSMEGDLSSSIEFCRRAISLNPNNAVAQASCGFTLVCRGEKEDGLEHLEISFRIDPEPVRSGLGLGYFIAGRYQEAIETLTGGDKAPSEDILRHAVLAAAYVRVGNGEEARREVNETLRIYPFFDAATFAANNCAAGKSKDLLAALQDAGFARR